MGKILFYCQKIVSSTSKMYESLILIYLRKGFQKMERTIII